MRLCNPEFLKTATASALQTEIDKGADINGRDDNLNTPLHFTAFGAMPARCAPC
jgi:ankyrin repeat protein